AHMSRAASPARPSRPPITCGRLAAVGCMGAGEGTAIGTSVPLGGSLLRGRAELRWIVEDDLRQDLRDFVEGLQVPGDVFDVVRVEGFSGLLEDLADRPLLLLVEHPAELREGFLAGLQEPFQAGLDLQDLGPPMIVLLVAARVLDDPLDLAL